VQDKSVIVNIVFVQSVFGCRSSQCALVTVILIHVISINLSIINNVD